MPRRNTFNVLKGKLQGVFHSHSSSISEKELKEFKEIYNKKVNETNKDNKETSESADTSTIEGLINTRAITDTVTETLPPESVSSPAQLMSRVKSATTLKMETNSSWKKHSRSVSFTSLSISASNAALMDKDKILLEPYNYLLANPGKEIRTKLIEAFDYWLQLPKEQMMIITKVVTMLHTASLLIDDVEDFSELRRGVPAAHQIYGTPATINCANYVYFLALDELARLDNPRVYQIFTDELLSLHRGQGMELYWRDTLTCPSEEEFIEMVSNKTGGLLRLAIKLMQEASESDVDYVDLVNIIGIHFQIRDDYMNLQSQKYIDNKGFCEDLTEGKFSFPIMHSIQSNPSSRQLIHILKQHTTSIELKHYAVKLMQNTDSFAYTRKYLAKTEASARTEIARLGGNPMLEEIMDLLSVPEDSNVKVS
ncbi:68_t:CDS:2 [Paraglomus brasilianum]|uniref:68_t:CDS:1 n=1 Tax=Paraglomus brasilianum TaxID=144538 RepID=A0A9N9GDA2_9GLOM|nr:68_t:CDS:2 [Paraglomus brasilianum]